MTDGTPTGADPDPRTEPSGEQPVVRQHGCVAHGLVWLVAGTALVVLMAGVTLACFWLSRLGG